MSKNNEIKLFDQKQVRSIWNADQEKWYMSIVDVIAVLTESIDPNAYWRKLKQRLKEEGNETVTNCHGLKMMAADGKMRNRGLRKNCVKKIRRRDVEMKLLLPKLGFIVSL